MFCMFGMFGMKAKSHFDGNKIRRAANRANFTNLSHAAAAIRMTARRSIRKAPKIGGNSKRGGTSKIRTRPSPPGSPPHTRAGQIKRAILYAVERKRGRALIGPTYEGMGTSAGAHEFGGRFRGQHYAKRPFMGPALKENLPRLPRLWSGSVR